MAEIQQEYFDALYLGTMWNQISVAITILLCYEYTVTFERELRYIWGRKFSWATLLFVANRYGALLCSVVMAASYFPWGNLPQTTADKICNGWSKTIEILSLIQELGFVAFTTLRLFAIWGKDRRVLGAMILLGTISLAFDVTLSYIIFFPNDIAYSPDTSFVCFYTVPFTLTEYDLLFYGNTISGILFDFVTVLLVWIRTYTTVRQISAFGSQPKLSVLLLRDGSIYFMTLLTLNVLYLALPRYNDMYIFVSGFSSILVSRFFFNLREIDTLENSYDGSGIRPPTGSDLRFASNHGTIPLGGPLVSIFGSDELPEDA